MFSIITKDDSKCFICGTNRLIEIHHIYGGAFRKKSTKYGLVVPLCKLHHNEPPNGAHYNRETMDYLRRIGQQAFIEHYPNKDFMQEFGRNFL